MNQFVKKITFGLPIFCFWFQITASGQSPFFEKRFGGAGVQVAQSAVQGSDSAVYLFGYAESGTAGDYDMCLMKITSSGDSVWTRYYGTSRVEFGNAINAFGSDRLVLIGTTADSMLQNGDDVMMLLVDTAGNELWRRVYGGPGSQGSRWVEATADSGFIFCGFTPDIFGSNNAWVVKTDALGTVQWSATPGGVENDVAMRVIATGDSTWVMTGDSKSAGNGNYDVWIVGFNNQGQVTFDHIHTDSLTNGCQGMMKTSSGRLVSFGETEVSPGSFFDFQLHVFDMQGNFIRDHHFGGNGADALFDMVECDNGDWLGTGYSNSHSGGMLPIDVALVRMDSVGNLQWTRHYGGNGIDLGYKLIRALGGGYFAAGRGTGLDEDFYLLRFGEDGLLGINQVGIQETALIEVYPNPVTSRLTARSYSGISYCEISDLAGRGLINSKSAGSLSVELDVSELNAGIYFLQAIDIFGKTSCVRWVLSR